jgi:hypothetical protein
MIGAMAALGQSVSGLGGDFEDQSAANQESQGTNIWGEKSESIANSIDITADATDKLVGINTGMLKALQAMQAGISGAAGITARGIKGADFNFNPDVIENIYAGISRNTSKLFTEVLGDTLGELVASMGNIIPDAIGKLLGGSSSVVGSGIKILGGTLAEMIDGAAVFAFELTESRKTIFNSKHINDQSIKLDDASTQFALVFESLASSVTQGALALGLSSDLVKSKVDNFEIALTEISTLNLGEEDTQKEIEAVFSKIFDDLSYDQKKNKRHLFACKENNLNEFYLSELRDKAEEFRKTFAQSRLKKMKEKIIKFGTPYEMQKNT